MNAKKPEPKPYGEFDFDLAGAVQEQLLKAFNVLPIGPLSEELTSELRVRHGVYQLFLHGVLVYIGKAKSLKARLRRHRFRLGGRKNLNLADVGFKCLYVHKNWTPMTHEEALIRLYQREGSQLWNGMGFGSNDPGRNREQTNQPPEGFHRQFPINSDLPCDFLEPGTWKVRDLLRHLKGELPFLLRYEGHTRGGHADFVKKKVAIAASGRPLSEVLTDVARALPRGWQLTIFPSHVILYKESRAYDHGEVLWPPAD
jgi:hypothetical protein